MLKPSYFLALDECIGDTLDEFANRLKRLPKKPVGDVTISELCAVAEYPNGLYFLFDDKDHVWYVGKATSRSFIERLPSHFDPRETSWFGTIPKKIMRHCSLPTYRDAHALGLTLRLALLGVTSKQTATRLESTLRDFLQPELNRTSRRRAIGNERLSMGEGLLNSSKAI
jgi:hypothetical protein